MSYFMPVIFMFVLNNFSAGLSFYYFVSNLVTFGQQAVIRRFVDEKKIIKIMDENKKKAVTGTGKKSSFMSKLEQAMKAGEEARKKKWKVLAWRSHSEGMWEEGVVRNSEKWKVHPGADPSGRKERKVKSEKSWPFRAAGVKS